MRYKYCKPESTENLLLCVLQSHTMYTQKHVIYTHQCGLIDSIKHQVGSLQKSLAIK